MSNDKFLDKAYDLDGEAQTRAHYDDWSASYDAEISRNGYATPARISTALASFTPDKSAAILDFGCGTGMSGDALARAGFSVIDGVDLSPDMLAQARKTKTYRHLNVIEPDAHLPLKAGDYSAIVACGVIGAGGAPLSTFDVLMALLPKGGLFAFSFNDHTLQDPAYEAKLQTYLHAKSAKLCHREHGDHLPGINLGAVVYVVEKL